MAITASQQLARLSIALPLVLAFMVNAMALRPVDAKDIHIAVLGDSLSAGFQLPRKAAFPVQLEEKLRKQGHTVRLLNAAVSGDTTGAGLARLDWAIPDGIDGVILELGANDALRGIDPAKTYNNLQTIIERLQKRGIAVFLAGMQAPRNLGESYVQTFDDVFPSLAKKHGLPLYPFFLDGVVFNKSLLLSDGMHPNSKGVAMIAERILPHIAAWLPSIGNRSSGHR